MSKQSLASIYSLEELENQSEQYKNNWTDFIHMGKITFEVYKNPKTALKKVRYPFYIRDQEMCNGYDKHKKCLPITFCALKYVANHLQTQFSFFNGTINPKVEASSSEEFKVNATNYFRNENDSLEPELSTFFSCTVAPEKEYLSDDFSFFVEGEGGDNTYQEQIYVALHSIPDLWVKKGNTRNALKKILGFKVD